MENENVILVSKEDLKQFRYTLQSALTNTLQDMMKELKDDIVTQLSKSINEFRLSTSSAMNENARVIDAGLKGNSELNEKIISDIEQRMSGFENRINNRFNNIASKTDINNIGKNIVTLQGSVTSLRDKIGTDLPSRDDITNPGIVKP